jgi:hypothetical protein
MFFSFSCCFSLFGIPKQSRIDISNSLPEAVNMINEQNICLQALGQVEGQF